MQNYGYGNSQIICPQITCCIFLILSIIGFFGSLTNGLSIFSSLISIICYGVIYYLVYKGIQLRVYLMYFRGLIISLIYSIISTILNIDHL